MGLITSADAAYKGTMFRCTMVHAWYWNMSAEMWSYEINAFY